MLINNKQRKFLRAQAHPLKVVVTVGAKGLSDPVKEEVALALSKHELIKLKLPADDKKIKLEMLEILCKELDAAQVQLIGRVGILYRPADPAVIRLP